MKVSNVSNDLLPIGPSLRHKRQNREQINRRHGADLKGVDELGVNVHEIDYVRRRESGSAFAVNDAKCIRSGISTKV